MGLHVIFAGGYGGFNASYSSNTGSSSLTLVGRRLVTQGSTVVFRHHSKRVLSAVVDIVPSGGDAPAFAAALSPGKVAIMNYTSGHGRVHGTKIFVYAIWRASPSSGGVYSNTGSIRPLKGSGPLHIRIWNDQFYTMHDVTYTLSVQTIPAAPNGTSPTTSSVSIIPADAPPGAVWAATEILIPSPPPGWAGLGNRNTGEQMPAGHSVAIFEHIDQATLGKKLQLVTQI
ncbi:hypothetical protein B0H12DRAFT_1254388 [Mycena haematopus]|nr:hypothetical protein B0H12DRAFT_1254388 [Mycena haematopus]